MNRSQKCLLCGNLLKVQVTIKELFSFHSANSDLICSSCRDQFSRIQPGCKMCSKSGKFDYELCDDCIYWKRRGMVMKNISIYEYNNFMSDYFKQYKFNGNYYFRNIFITEFTQVASNFKRVLVPIPVSEGTLNQRGFNQVTGFLNCSFSSMLETKKGYHQSRLNRDQRRKMIQPFILKTEWQNRLNGVDVLLLDDIYTTGTTLHLAANLLLNSGAHSVQSLTLAR